MISFRSQKEYAEFHIPGTNQPLRKYRISFRQDPLTGDRSVITDGLIKKSTLFFGSTDYELIKEMARSSRSGCFFCPEKVESVTPKYPQDFIPSGRLKGERAILFPNLFPLARIHAVVTIPEAHYLLPGDFKKDLLEDIMKVSGVFIKKTTEEYDDLGFISLNLNHLPPAGASLFHPHFQIYGCTEIPSDPGRILDSVAQHHVNSNFDYWAELIKKENKLQERWIGSTGSWNWIAAFAPSGSNEIFGVHSDAVSPSELSDKDYTDLADGMSKVLKYFHGEGYSSFNFTMYGDLRKSSPANRTVAKIITRQNFHSNYRTDDYFLQKFMGIELTVVPPEYLANELRKFF